jgi:predicted permease
VGAGAIALAVALGAVVCAHQSSTPAAELLQSAARAIGSARITRSRSTLVALQIALAVLLLAGAGLMAKSFARLQHVRPGFDPDGLLTFRLAVPEPRYAGRERAAFVDDLVTRLNAIAGVRSAAVNTRLPFGGARGANGVAIDGRPAAAGETIAVDQREVTPAYFQTMRIPVLSGRAFSDRDDGSSEAVAIVNRTMAARYWRDGRAVDHLVRVAAGEEASGWLRIVGVVDDVRHTSLAKAPVAELYRPFAQMPLADFSVVLRTAGDPSLAAPSARATVASLDRNLAVYDVRPMDARIAASFAQTRATARLLLAAALMAALLAAVAIFGAIWYAVTERQAEIGVRMALGATPATVWRLVVGGAVAVAGWGMGVGLAAAFALTPLMQSMLFDVRANDPATYAAVGAGILLLTLAASAAPARRAMRIDALTAIRRD